MKFVRSGCRGWVEAPVEHSEEFRRWVTGRFRRPSRGGSERVPKGLNFEFAGRHLPCIPERWSRLGGINWRACGGKEEEEESGLCNS